MKIFKVALLVLILIYIPFSIYGLINMSSTKVDNSILRNALKEQEILTDLYERQLDELVFIFEQTCRDKDKYAIYNSILLYQDKKEDEFKKKGIDFIEIPKINIEKANILYGHNGELKFHFYENGKLKEIEYPHYGAVYKNVLNNTD